MKDDTPLRAMIKFQGILDSLYIRMLLETVLCSILCILYVCILDCVKETGEPISLQESIILAKCPKMSG